MFRNSNDGRTEKLAFLSVTVWEPGTGGQDVETRVQARTHETTDTLRCEAGGIFFGGVNAVQRQKPGAMRCTAPRWTSEVRMPELVACQSAPAQAVRLASSSDASSIAHSTGSAGSGSGSICLANKAPVACSSLASSTASWKSVSVWARKRRQPVVHDWFFCRRSP